VPSTFEKDLFPGDLERLMPHVEACMARVPSFENAGIKDIVNGPISYAPDGNPLVGPVPGGEELMVCVRGDGGVLSGARCRADARAMEDRGRTETRCDGDGCGAVWRLDQPRLYPAQGEIECSHV